MMTIFVTVTPTVQWSSALLQSKTPVISKGSLVKQKSSPQVLETPVSSDEIVSILINNTDVIVCYESPSSFLARRLMEDSSIEVALEASQEYITQLLHIYKQHRSNISLLNFTEVAALSSGTEQLNDLGWEIEGKLKTDKCSVYLLAAKQLIKQQEDLDNACNMLHASSLFISDESSIDDISAIISSYRAHESSLIALREEYEATKEELTQRSLINHELLNEKALYLNSIESLNKQHEVDLGTIAELETKRCELEAIRDSYATEITELKAEVALTTASIASLQNELELRAVEFSKLTTKYNQLEEEKLEVVECNSELCAEKELLRHTISSLQDELELSNLRASSYEAACCELKVAESDSCRDYERRLAESIAENEIAQQYIIRAADLEILYSQLALDMSEKSKKLNAAQHEIDKLKDQLHNLQSSMNKLTQEKSILKRDHVREVKKLKRKLVNEKASYQELVHQFLDIKDKLRSAESELTGIKTSTTWKISAPARAVSKKFRKEDLERQVLKQDMGLLYTSDLFDSQWYLESYPDVAATGIDPAEHYILHGASEGRLPSASFDGDWYLQQNPDVAEMGLNPLIHYIKYGVIEKRSISPRLLEKR